MKYHEAAAKGNGFEHGVTARTKRTAAGSRRRRGAAPPQEKRSKGREGGPNSADFRRHNFAQNLFWAKLTRLRDTGKNARRANSRGQGEQPPGWVGGLRREVRHRHRESVPNYK